MGTVFSNCFLLLLEGQGEWKRQRRVCTHMQFPKKSVLFPKGSGQSIASCHCDSARALSTVTILVPGPIKKKEG